MNLLDMDDLKCFYSKDTLTMVDVIHPNTGRGAYGNRTLEGTRKEYPDAEVWDLEKAIEHKNEGYKTPPVKITEEQFFDALCVLPPVGHTVTKGAETFKMSEMTSGTITNIYCKIGNDFWVFGDDVQLKHEDIVKRCWTLFKKGA